MDAIEFRLKFVREKVAICPLSPRGLKLLVDWGMTYAPRVDGHIMQYYDTCSSLCIFPPSLSPAYGVCFMDGTLDTVSALIEHGYTIEYYVFSEGGLREDLPPTLLKLTPELFSKIFVKDKLAVRVDGGALEFAKIADDLMFPCIEDETFVDTLNRCVVDINDLLGEDICICFRDGRIGNSELMKYDSYDVEYVVDLVNEYRVAESVKPDVKPELGVKLNKEVQGERESLVEREIMECPFIELTDGVLVRVDEILFVTRDSVSFKSNSKTLGINSADYTMLVERLKGRR